MQIQIKKEFKNCFEEYFKTTQKLEFPILAVINSKEESVRVYYLLFAVALYQHIRWHQLAGFINLLFDEFGERLWVLPPLSSLEIDNFLNKNHLYKDWSLKEYIPGILWSVGAFIRKYPNLHEFIAQSEPKVVLKELSIGIFYFGKNNRFLRKARWFIFLYFWNKETPNQWKKMRLIPSLGAVRAVAHCGYPKILKMQYFSPEQILVHYQCFLESLSVGICSVPQAHMALCFYAGQNKLGELKKWESHSWVY
jgi:hypothetical protein